MSGTRSHGLKLLITPAEIAFTYHLVAHGC
jgi:hypothetical protein